MWRGIINIMLKIFLSGTAILIAAIAVNAAAKTLGLQTWYDFLGRMSERGVATALQDTAPLSLLFLFVIYPLFLGICVKVLSMYL
jgi:hypothetical protein